MRGSKTPAFLIFPFPFFFCTRALRNFFGQEGHRPPRSEDARAPVDATLACIVREGFVERDVNFNFCFQPCRKIMYLYAAFQADYAAHACIFCSKLVDTCWF